MIMMYLKAIHNTICEIYNIFERDNEPLLPPFFSFYIGFWCYVLWGLIRD